MGVVWRAMDTRLGRQVALKVLPPDRVGDEERRLRFVREARAAAAVNHPNIAAIYEIGEAGGTVFIAMELVEGMTLRERMADARLPMREMLRFSVEITEALASAHQAGVVHRDLKPDNVMVRPDGHVKVLDFGLAKLRERVEGDSDETRMQTISAEMTQAGRIMGTAAYMSPEQARGRSVDFRSDLFSFGAMLYEMATGVSPFQADNVTDTLSSVVRDRPREASEINPEVSGELGRILGKCLEKDPGERFQDTADLALDLRKLRRATDSHTAVRVTDSTPMTAVRTPAWRRPGVLIPVALAVLVLLALALLWPRVVPGPGSTAGHALAVMPFENMKDPADSDRLGQILQELIITDLSEVDSLGVFSSQRLYDIHKQLTGTSERTIDRSRITEVANKVGATTLLTGSLSQLGSRWILTGQLIDLGSGKVLQSERIDGEDLYSMVDQLAGRIRADILDSAAVTADRDVQEQTTDSLEAYQVYLEGLELLSRRDYRKADEKFLAALKLDPRFGLAQFQLAISRGWGFTPEAESPEELLEALLEDDRFKLPAKERLLARVGLAYHRDEFAEAERLAREAVERYPDEKGAWYRLGDILYHRPGGSYEKALEYFERALELDPTFEVAYTHIDNIYQAKGMWDELSGKVQALVRAEPDNPTWYAEWAGALLQMDDVEGAEDVLQQGLDRVQSPDPRRRLLSGVGAQFTRTWHAQRGKELLERALEVPATTEEAAILAQLGWIARDLNHVDEAEQSFRRSLDLNPRNSSAFWGLRITLFDQDRYGDAILKFRSLLPRAPDHMLLHGGWMEAALYRGDEEEARRAHREALAGTTTDSARGNAWGLLATAYARVGDAVQGLECRRKAVELTEGNPDAPDFSVAWAYRSNDRLEEAEEMFLALLSTHNDLGGGSALQGLYSINRALAKTDEALRYAERRRDVRPTDAATHQSVVEIHLAAGRTTEAERALQRGLDFLRLPRARADLYVWASWAYRAAGQPARAEELVQKALAVEGTSERRWYLEALIDPLIDQGKYDEAEDAVEHLEAVQGGRLFRGQERYRIDLALGRGDTDDAVRQALDALSRAPGSAGRIAQARGTLAAHGDFAGAEPHARRLLAMDPDRAAHVFLAWILLAGDLDVEEGASLAEKGVALPADWGRQAALNARPWLPSAEHVLGLARLKQGRRAQAIPLLEKAAALQPTSSLVQEHLEQARR
jgi:tetratricopeptide (TPR) repeat protein/TolB-like protein